MPKNHGVSEIASKEKNRLQGQRNFTNILQEACFVKDHLLSFAYNKHSNKVGHGLKPKDQSVFPC